MIMNGYLTLNYCLYFLHNVQNYNKKINVLHVE